MKKNTSTPIAIVMGSDSDLEVMNACVDQLKCFDITPEVRILSAHRTPVQAAKFAEDAADQGIKLIIAAAGMAAHLAGALAGRTHLPVIGVPLVSGSLGGIDALLSTVQMPPGVPVASMGLGKAGAKNAALFAVQILSLSDSRLNEKLKTFRLDQSNKALEKDAAL
jgi:phosphoribosylaminoimidazole carboxylase PurE protein